MKYLYVLCKMFPAFTFKNNLKWWFYIDFESFIRIKELLNSDFYEIINDESPFYENDFLIIKVKNNLWDELNELEKDVSKNPLLEKELINLKYEITCTITKIKENL